MDNIINHIEKVFHCHICDLNFTEKVREHLNSFTHKFHMKEKEKERDMKKIMFLIKEYKIHTNNETLNNLIKKYYDPCPDSSESEEE